MKNEVARLHQEIDALRAQFESEMDSKDLGDSVEWFNLEESELEGDADAENEIVRAHFDKVMARVLSMPAATPETFHLVSQLANHLRGQEAPEDMDDLNFPDHMGHHVQEEEETPEPWEETPEPWQDV